MMAADEETKKLLSRIGDYLQKSDPSDIKIKLNSLSDKVDQLHQDMKDIKTTLESDTGIKVRVINLEHDNAAHFKELKRVEETVNKKFAEERKEQEKRVTFWMALIGVVTGIITTLINTSLSLWHK